MQTMVIIAHPDLTKSRANQALANGLPQKEEFTIRDLYSLYPHWQIDIEQEQEWLLQSDRIILQFPFYWYSCPPLLKKWFDDVLTYGWAFGPGGENLKGKEFIVATTTGGTANGYQAGGYDWFTISEYLKPIQATIKRCHGTFLPPFVMYNAEESPAAELEQEVARYQAYIQRPAESMID